MNIAIFADVHGRVLLAFQLCARWQQETGEHIDLILQAGDLGAFSAADRLDKATRRYADRDSTELGFLENFRWPTSRVSMRLAQTTCPLVFVRGNHEDHAWLDTLEMQSKEALFPIDPYKRVYLLKTGVPWTFKQGSEQITILGIGRIGAPSREEDHRQSKYIQDYELERLYQLKHMSLDILLTHDSRPNTMSEPGGKIKTRNGMKEIEYLLERDRPIYHFYGHYGGPPLVQTDTNGATISVKLADLHWQGSGGGLARGSMGLLRWRDREHHSFTVLDDPWLKEYTLHTWHHL